VHFLGILSYGDMSDNIFPFVGYGSVNYFVIAAKIDKDPLSLCTMEHSHTDGSAHLACNNSSSTFPNPSSNARILLATTV
jgi:hypothetical protein